MTTFVSRLDTDIAAAELFDWHLRPGAFERLVPPWDQSSVVARSGRIQDNSMTVRLRVPGPAGVATTWTISHDSYEAGHRFRDVLERGPFPEWAHVHEVIDTGTGTSQLIDTVNYRLPVRGLGNALAGRYVHSRLEQVFAWRRATIAEDLAAHGRADLGRGKKIGITGATGLIGRLLAAYLATAGHTVVPIVRRPPRTVETGDPIGMVAPVIWDPSDGTLPPKQLEGLDAVVHLAGESIAGSGRIPSRWNDDRRASILSSRVEGTSLLARTLASLSSPPSVLICASAIGAYGDRGDVELDESAEYGSGFLPDVARRWEAAADPARNAGIRTVHARLGIVLTPRGGALWPLLTASKVGAGGPLGSGRQWYSWVSLDDVLTSIEHLIARPEVSGPVNIVAPNPARMRDIARTLGRVIRRPALLPAPAPAVRAILGRGMADELLLCSARVSPTALADSDFVFRDPDLEPALRRMLGRVQL